MPLTISDYDDIKRQYIVKVLLVWSTYKNIRPKVYKNTEERQNPHVLFYTFTRPCRILFQTVLRQSTLMLIWSSLKHLL